jgi:hypothetical protein
LDQRWNVLPAWTSLCSATYLELCERTAEVDPGQKQCGIVLLDRVALRVRGLSRVSY